MPAGLTHIAFDSAHGAAEAVSRAAQDVAEARSASAANRGTIVGQLIEVAGSRVTVQSIFDAFRAALDGRVNEVIGSDWESLSKDSFVGGVDSIREALRRIEDNYVAEYEAAIEAINRLRDAMERLDIEFGGACDQYESAYAEAAQRAHTHIDQVQQLTSTSLG